MRASPMRFILTFAAAAGSATLVSMPLHAAGASLQQQPTSTIRVTAPGSNRQICTTERPTGSRFARRVCRSQADREADRQAQQDSTREFQTDGFVSPGDTANSVGGPE